MDLVRAYRGGCLVHSVATQFNLLHNPDICESLKVTERNPLEIVKEAIRNIQDDEVVLAPHHIGVRR